MRFWRRGIISLAVMKRPASYDLVAEDMENLIFCAIVRTGTLMLGTGKFSDSMICVPD